MGMKLRWSVSRIVGQLKELNRNARIDLFHPHGLLPCGHALMLLDERTEHLVVVKFEIHRASAVSRPVGNCWHARGYAEKATPHRGTKPIRCLSGLWPNV